MKSGPIRRTTAKKVKSRTDRRATHSRLSGKKSLKKAGTSIKTKPAFESRLTPPSVEQRGRKTEDELNRYYKLEIVGALAGGIAHDINNALTAIMHNVYAAKMFFADEAKRKEVPELLDAGMKTIRRATALTNRLLALSAEGKPLRKSTYLKNMIKDTSRISLSGSKVMSEFHIADDLWPVYVDEGQVAQVISNLIIHAKQAMPGGGTIDLIAENVISGKNERPRLKGDKYVKLSFKRRGAGIAKEHRNNIFNAKEEWGFPGLTASNSIIRQNGGIISIESEEGVDTTVHIYLPTSETGIETGPEVEEVGGGGNILVMENEEDIADSMQFALALLGYETEFVRDGAGAIEAYEKSMQSDRPFDILILDLNVPGGIGGLEVIRALKRIYPDVTAVIASGYPNDPVMMDFKRFGFSAAIEKPHSVEDLDRLLKRLMATKGG